MDNVISALSTYLQSPMLAAFAMYVALIGIAILRGAVTDTFGDMLGRILKFALIAWVVMNASVYVTYVRDLFIDTLPNDLTTAVAGAGNGQQLASASFDQLFSKAYVLGLQIWQQASWDDFGPILAVLIFWVVSLVVVAFLFVLFLYARFGLDLVVAVGPIFICFALFNPTRMLFERWAFTALHYVVLQVFIVVVLALLISAAGQATRSDRHQHYRRRHVPCRRNLPLHPGRGSGWRGAPERLCRREDAEPGRTRRALPRERGDGPPAPELDRRRRRTPAGISAPFLPHIGTSAQCGLLPAVMPAAVGGKDLGVSCWRSRPPLCCLPAPLKSRCPNARGKFGS